MKVVFEVTHCVCAEPPPCWLSVFPAATQLPCRPGRGRLHFPEASAFSGIRATPRRLLNRPLLRPSGSVTHAPGAYFQVASLTPFSSKAPRDCLRRNVDTLGPQLFSLETKTSWLLIMEVVRRHLHSGFQLCVHFLGSCQGKESWIPSGTCNILAASGNPRGSCFHKVHLDFQGSYSQQTYPAIQIVSSQFLRTRSWWDVDIRQEASTFFFFFSPHILCDAMDPRKRSINLTCFRGETGD